MSGKTTARLGYAESVHMFQVLSGNKALSWRPREGGIGRACHLPRCRNMLHDDPAIHKTAQVSTTADIVTAKRELCDGAVRAGTVPTAKQV